MNSNREIKLNSQAHAAPTSACQIGGSKPRKDTRVWVDVLPSAAMIGIDDAKAQCRMIDPNGKLQPMSNQRKRTTC